MGQTINLKDLLYQINQQHADWFSLRHMSEVFTTQVVRNQKPQTNFLSDDSGLLIEVFKDGCVAYAATSKFDRVSVQAAFDTALRSAALSASLPVARFERAAVRPDVVDQFFGACEVPFDKLGMHEVTDILMEASQIAGSSRQVVKALAVAHYGTRTTEIVSSSGTHLLQRISLCTVDVEAIAQDGGITQKRTMGGLRGLSHQGGAELINRKRILEGAARVGAEAVELLGAMECPTGLHWLVIAPDQMMLQIHESIGHPLELDRILGDERNYAGWSFVKPNDFGKLAYGSKILNVTFDPTIPEEFATYAYDDIGAKASKEFLIKDGVLMRGLGSLESQARLGVPGVSNQRASSWNRPPIDRMANLNIEPGTSSLEEIIEDVQDGIYMESNRSWSIDDFRNKFQFGCEYGRLIKDGKLGDVVRNPNYRGVTTSFWHNLTHVGNRATCGVYGTPYCGKGEPNQSVRVGHASPVCAFKDVEVFGGAQ